MLWKTELLEKSMALHGTRFCLEKLVLIEVISKRHELEIIKCKAKGYYV